VLVPYISPRVEQRYERASNRIQSGDIWAFVSVAVAAAQCKIREQAPAAMLAGDDVIENVP
jgi:hypothetical protein